MQIKRYDSFGSKKMGKNESKCLSLYKEAISNNLNQIIAEEKMNLNVVVKIECNNSGKVIQRNGYDCGLYAALALLNYYQIFFSTSSNHHP